jgi:CRISPR-associated endonuclease/helicase Cas3
VEQTASVLIAMLLLKELTGQAKSPRFLFLSATPQALLTHLAGKVGLSVALIEGEYRHGDAQPAAGYRRILQATDLYLHSGNLRDWVAEHFEDTILPFFVANRPGAKGLIIANSVATAHRIHADLQPLCKQANIHLGINTGLTPKADRSRMFDLLIATSTVDVGADFKINFLVFESRDAASHLQRLGRLGRHEHDPSGNLFGQFEAHALLPAWTLEGKTKALSGNEPISREDYRIALTENYSPLQQFDGYIRHWAGIQATKVLKELKNPYIHTQYETLRLRLESNYKQLFGNNMVKKYVSLSNEKRGATLAAASSFRGGNVFSALIQDPETDSQQVVSYNLMSLLRQADLQPVAIPEMLAVAQRRGQDIRSLEKTNPLAAYRLLSWRDEPRKISIELDAQLPPERHEVVIEQNRFRILCTGMAELQALNENTYERVWVAFMIPNKDPDLVRRLLRLGYQLELFDFQAAGNLRGTIAFGRDALLLDSVLIRQRDTSTSFIW